MKRTQITLCTVLAFGMSMASALAATTSETNTNLGNYEVGGTFSYLHQSFGDLDSNVLSVSPSAEYFLMDHFSLGGSVIFSKNFASGGNTEFAVGPSATYRFWEEGKCSAYVALATLWDHNSTSGGTHSYTIAPSVGYDHFFTPSVALGPAIVWSHTFGVDGGPARNIYGLVAGFHVFL